MAPKKKGGKKQADDWENDLGETIDPIAQATADAKLADAAKDAEDGEMNGGGGGLLAALRKNKDRRAKKGKPPANDFVEGEDADGTALADPAIDLASKAPAEATFDEDEDDVFAGNANKAKGGKGGKKQQETSHAEEDVDDEEGGGMKSKKEKEREKKEREKQRKKEQVGQIIPVCCSTEY